MRLRPDSYGSDNLLDALRRKQGERRALKKREILRRIVRYVELAQEWNEALDSRIQ